MFQNIVAIGLGGGLGALLRYAVVGITHRLFSHQFPLGTLFVNLAGSFFIGLLWAVLSKSDLAQHYRLFVFIGLLGGFTTFSSFALENYYLIEHSHFKLLVLNLLLNNGLGILFVFGGMWIAEFFWKVG